MVPNRVALPDQIEATELAAAALGEVLKSKDFYKTYPGMVDFEIANLRAVVRTLTWFQTHEQTIRDAVRLAVDTRDGT